MKTYKITATRIDNNRVRVSSSDAETLGDAYMVTYISRTEAEQMAQELENYKGRYNMTDAKFELIEEDPKYTVTVKTDCSYWGDDTDRESAMKLARQHGAKIEAALPGINVRYCDLIGHGNADDTSGPDDDVCEKIDAMVAGML
jgi:hypothetical protein